MCNCSELSNVFVDLDSSWIENTIPYQGKDLFIGFFMDWDSEHVEPELNYSKSYYLSVVRTGTLNVLLMNLHGHYSE